MKHILPILTAALALTATTASAATTYSSFQDFLNDTTYASKYGFYNEPTVTTENGVQTINYGKFSVIKDVSNLEYQTHFKIRANETIKLFIYDYVSNFNSNNSGTSLESLVSNIGYRSETEYDVHGLGTPIELEDVPNVSTWNPDIVRNSYYLGTFTKDTEYDIFLQRTDSETGAWSSQNFNNTLDSGYSFYDDTTDGTPAEITSSNGFVHVDKLMAAYLAKDPNVMIGDGADVDFLLSVANAMPFAALNGVSFGMYAKPATMGSPLPGGLQIALIAGLFGLGFWYIRRRKAIAA